MLKSTAVAEALGRSGKNPREAASTLRRDGRLLGIPDRHRFIHPAFQFDLEAGRVRAIVAG